MYVSYVESQPGVVLIQFLFFSLMHSRQGVMSLILLAVFRSRPHRPCLKPKYTASLKNVRFVQHYVVNVEIKRKRAAAAAAINNSV